MYALSVAQVAQRNEARRTDGSVCCRIRAVIWMTIKNDTVDLRVSVIR